MQVQEIELKNSFLKLAFCGYLKPKLSIEDRTKYFTLF